MNPYVALADRPVLAVVLLTRRAEGMEYLSIWGSVSSFR